MSNQYDQLDALLRSLRRRIDRAGRGALTRAEVDDLHRDCIAFRDKARRLEYFAIGLRAIDNFIANSSRQDPSAVSKGASADHRRATTQDRIQGDPTNGEGLRHRPPQSRYGFVPPANPPKSAVPPEGITPTAEVPGTARPPLPPTPVRTESPTTITPSPAQLKGVMGKQLTTTPVRPQADGPPQRPHQESHRSTAIYRTYLTSDSGVEFTQVLNVVREWMIEKEIHADLSTSGRFVHPDNSSITEITRVTTPVDLFRLTLIEKNADSGATYNTNLVINGGGSPWVWLDISNDINSYVAVPRVAQRLLKRFPFFDGSWPMRPDATPVRTEGVPSLLKALADPHRRVPLLVAGSTDDPDMNEVFQLGLKHWGRQVFGMGGVALLDPPATQEFNKTVQRNFHLSPWSLRTFLPDLDLDDPSSSTRHRFVGAKRLVEDRPDRVASLLGHVARSVASTKPAPAAVLDALHRLDQESNRRLLESLRVRQTREGPRDTEILRRHRRTPDDGEVQTPLTELEEQVAMVLDILGIPSFEDERLLDIAEVWEVSKQAEGATEQIASRLERLEEDNARLRSDREQYIALTELAESETALSGQREFELREQVLYLQSQLAKYENAADVYDEFTIPPAQGVPENMEDLVDRLVELEEHHVYFTGDARITEALAEQDHAGAVVRTTWEALQACVDYLRCKSQDDFQGSLHDYLKASPSGYRSFPVGKHAALESESTRNQFWRERVFPVPAAVRDQKETFMESHFKLAKIGMVSPRMHYFDDSNSSGCIYVGYIGPHLQTVGTN